MVGNEQPNIVDNVDLQDINQHDVNMELEEEQTSSKQVRSVPKLLINTLMDSKLTFPRHCNVSRWRVVVYLQFVGYSPGLIHTGLGAR